MTSTKIKIGVIQATPVLFDLDKTMEKIASLIGNASKNGCNYLLFPEAFIPGYPRGLTFGTVVGSRSDEGRELWSHYWSNSIEVPGTHTDALGNMAKEHKVYLAIGVSEQDKVSGSLFCTMLYFSPSGKLIGKHRKIKPTAAERIIFAEGDGSTLTTFRTDFGVIGGLICWENYMPMARMAMYNKGVALYLAPTADARDGWITTLKHIALEGRCYVVGCNQFVRKSDYPAELHDELSGAGEIMCRGGSVIISPMGEVLKGPLYNKEGILVAELDSNEIVKSKLDFDVIGHYARNDMFGFEVKDIPETIVVE